MKFEYCPSCGKQGTVQKLDKTNYECSNCQWHHWNNSKAATAIALVNGEGKLLVVKRQREPMKGKFELAGGFVDFGEDAYEGAIREAQEELGVTIWRENLELLDVYFNTYESDITTVDIAFLVTEWEGELSANDDVASYAWRPLDFIYNPDFCQDYAGLDEKITAKLSEGK